MLVINPQFRRSAYPSDLKNMLNILRADECAQWLANWPQINDGATPLYQLPDLADQLGIGALYLKDESIRSPLGSFKALGAPVALLRQILRRHPEFDPQEILNGGYAAALQHDTVISATDGNHGRSLAAAARDAGCVCVIVLHAHVSAEREQAIAELGAQIIRIAGNYDDSVAHAASLAQANGWQVISDTSYENYQDIPRDVMQGYAVIAAEAIRQGGAQSDAETGVEMKAAAPFSHIFLQGGVGGLAAGIISYCWEYFGAEHPDFVIVEPEQADCLLQSALQGQPALASGTVDSVMAGLACGATSPLAWRFLQPSAQAFLTIPDRQAVTAMQRLAQGSLRDIPVLSGESGAAGLAALLMLAASPDQAAQLGLNRHSRVLIINTEGATAPALYQQLTDISADQVLTRQRRWQPPAAGSGQQ